jgi:carbonic anhydrase
MVACMDARLNPYGLLGLREGDAHVIRNDCGMLTFRDDDFRQHVQEETGVKPQWAAEAFDDLEADVRQSIARIKASPFIPKKDQVRGFVYEVECGRLREVT